MSVDYALVLTALFPECLWGLNDNDLSTLSWDESNADAMPSQEMLDAAWPQVQYDREYAQVEQARHAAYVTDADPLFFKWQRGSGSEQAWLDSVQVVKDAYPYPEAP
jgi:hypothetical protein